MSMTGVSAVWAMIDDKRTLKGQVARQLVEKSQAWAIITSMGSSAWIWSCWRKLGRAWVFGDYWHHVMNLRTTRDRQSCRERLGGLDVCLKDFFLLLGVAKCNQGSEKLLPNHPCDAVPVAWWCHHLHHTCQSSLADAVTVTWCHHRHHTCQSSLTDAATVTWCHHRHHTCQSKLTMNQRHDCHINTTSWHHQLASDALEPS